MNTLPISSPPSEHRASALLQVPPVVREYVQCTSAAWGVGVETLLAGALHHLGAVQAHRNRWRNAHVGHSCPFNLVVCNQRPVREGWYEYMGEHWMGVVRQNMREHQAKGRVRLEGEMRKLKESSRLPVGIIGSPMPAQLDRDLFEVSNQLKPCLIERRAGAPAAMKALENSKDLCVLLTNGGVDPIEEIMNSGRRACLDLSALLCLSWDDLGLLGKSPVPTRGIVHLFWNTHAGALRRLMISPGSPWASNLPPVLLVKQDSPAFLCDLPESDKQAAWNQLLQRSILERLMLDRMRTWSMSVESARILMDFRRQVEKWRELTGPWTSLGFIPALAVRMALLLSGLESSGQPIGLSPVLAAPEMERACHLATWMANEHLHCLRWLRNSSGDDVDGGVQCRDIDPIDMDVLQQAITEKLQTNGPMSPRELTRSFHSLRKRCRDAAIKGLVDKRIIEGLPNGRLKTASLVSSSQYSADIVSVSGASE